MRIELNFIDTFQYNGPYKTEFILEDENPLIKAIQDASDEDELNEALSNLLFESDLFLEHMKKNWTFPVRDKDCLCCDSIPEDLLFNIQRWNECSFTHHTVEVHRGSDTQDHDITTFKAHEEVVDGFEDSYLHISINHTELANQALKDKFKVLTEEERAAQAHELGLYYERGLYDDLD